MQLHKPLYATVQLLYGCLVSLWLPLEQSQLGWVPLGSFPV